MKSSLLLSSASSGNDPIFSLLSTTRAMYDRARRNRENDSGSGYNVGAIFCGLDFSGE